MRRAARALHAAALVAAILAARARGAPPSPDPPRDPLRELVVVRMGHQRGGPAAREGLNEALGMLTEALSRVAGR